MAPDSPADSPADPRTDLVAALRRLEESRDRLLLAQTRMTMATEQAAQSLQQLASLVTLLDQRPGNDPATGLQG